MVLLGLLGGGDTKRYQRGRFCLVPLLRMLPWGLLFMVYWP